LYKKIGLKIWLKKGLFFRLEKKIVNFRHLKKKFLKFKFFFIKFIFQILKIIKIFSSLKKSPFLSHIFKPIFYPIVLTLVFNYLFLLVSIKKEPDFFASDFLKYFFIKIINLLVSEKSMPHIHFLLKSAFLNI